AAENVAEAPPLQATAEDWPGFRGAQRDGVVRGTSIRTDWDAAPPVRLWKRRVGPGWSSIVVVGNRLYTQEQRGENEAVVCCDADTGRPVWVHEDAARFAEAMGGVGPRATPTFHEGRVYSLGATGVLNCLDAATGRLRWSRNVADDGQGRVPYWGFCSSPLIVDDCVIVFAGGGGDRNPEAPAGAGEQAPPPPATPRRPGRRGGGCFSRAWGH
ncbi:MAG TPA: PQQ-binding-like beta-propeller repeat protein, partial [Lacipirellulaceae bacterium]|nr:PQQ-binding-like beta-propeller repeat protein [Lacipirellulaceae bacterium]